MDVREGRFAGCVVPQRRGGGLFQQRIDMVSISIHLRRLFDEIGQRLPSASSSGEARSSSPR